MERDDSRPWNRIYRPELDPGLPELEPLRAQRERDPDLQEEAAREAAFDNAFAAQLRASPVPPDLEARLLAQLTADDDTEAAPPQRGPLWWIHPALFGAAAAAILFLIIGYTFFFPPNGFNSLPPEVQELVAAMEARSDDSPGRIAGNDYQQFVSFLQAHQSPTPETLPQALDKDMSVACESFEINGIGTGLVCFKQGSDVYHLFTLNRQDLPELKDLPAPKMTHIDDHCCAIWTTDDQVYVLTSKAKEKNVRKVLSI